MSFWKKRAFEQQSLGYSPPSDRFVCPTCVTDAHLAKALAAGGMMPAGVWL